MQVRSAQCRLYGDSMTINSIPCDKDLMMAVSNGDLEAFGEIVRRHQRTAWSVAYKFLSDSAEAEDITQDAFLRILAAAPRYKPSASFSTYLYRVIVRLCIDKTRKKGPIYTDDPPEMIAPSSCPDAALHAKERALQVRHALAMLPPRQRMAIILKYYEGQGYAEIARAMDITAKAVERLLSHARTALQSSLSHI